MEPSFFLLAWFVLIAYVIIINDNETNNED